MRCVHCLFMHAHTCGCAHQLGELGSYFRLDQYVAILDVIPLMHVVAHASMHIEQEAIQAFTRA